MFTRFLKFSLPTILIAALGCERSFWTPPQSDLLVSAGDSTYWVRSDGRTTSVRAASFLLAHVDGRFSEIYIVDQDRSFADAVIVGQRVYQRDLITGDSVLLLDDSTTREVAMRYAREHPGEMPLAIDEAENPDAATIAYTDTEIVDVLGPYVTYEQHIDMDGSWLSGSHSSRRGVIDLRTAQPVRLEDLVGRRGATTLRLQGVSMLGSASDSIRAIGDARAARAKEAIAGFVFDSSSFSLVESAGVPAIAFFVPGRGVRAAGYAFPLAPIDIPPGTWWQDVRATLPTSVPGGDEFWPGRDHEVVARYDTSGTRARILLRRPGKSREWPIADVQAPVRRVLRIPAAGPESTEALGRAFDDAVLYSGEARTASNTRSPAKGAARLRT
ncbi:MAG: hypothetical protein MNPFHGCM_02431 [Gemmatimonadaceae bacterium]|nr:hypothetical protein [Gemmatimonadaceae bacterium]